MYGTLSSWSSPNSLRGSARVCRRRTRLQPVPTTAVPVGLDSLGSPGCGVITSQATAGRGLCWPYPPVVQRHDGSRLRAIPYHCPREDFLRLNVRIQGWQVAQVAGLVVGAPFFVPDNSPPPKKSPDHANTDRADGYQWVHLSSVPLLNDDPVAEGASLDRGQDSTTSTSAMLVHGTTVERDTPASVTPKAEMSTTSPLMSAESEGHPSEPVGAPSCRIPASPRCPSHSRSPAPQSSSCHDILLRSDLRRKVGRWPMLGPRRWVLGI